MNHDIVLKSCNEISAKLLNEIIDSNALGKRLKAMGPAQFVAWIHDHVDEVEQIISSSYPIFQSLPARPRHDMLLYSAVFVCGLAASLLMLCQQQGWPLKGTPAERVASLGLHALALCGSKPALWPWDSEHPFA